MKLEIKHLAPYFPYGLKGRHVTREIMYVNSLYFPDYDNNEFNIKYPINGSGVGGYMNESLQNFKPILRPLSDLIKDIIVNGEDFVPYENHVFVEAMSANEYLEYLCDAKGDLSQDRLLPYAIVQLLFEWHFDVFGLIEKGLAINLNDIK